MADHKAFFYGTLMAPAVLHRVIHGPSSSPNIPPHALPLRIRPALLRAHQRHKVRSADYPAILPSRDESACVRGTLVEGLTDGDLWRLDIFEGDEYVRGKVMVKVLEGSVEGGDDKGANAGEEDEVVEAETYIWSAAPSRLEAEEWDFDEFVREKMARWVGREGAEGADEGFQDVDDAVAALQNDPTGGRGARGQISRALEKEGKANEEVLGSAV